MTEYVQRLDKPMIERVPLIHRKKVHFEDDQFVDLDQEEEFNRTRIRLPKDVPLEKKKKEDETPPQTAIGKNKLDPQALIAQKLAAVAAQLEN